MVRGPAAWRVQIGGYESEDNTGTGSCKVQLCLLVFP